MRELGDYLNLGPSAARRQWRSIVSRVIVERGRQVDFLPIETLMCLAASLLVNHRRYGGSTSHKAQEPVPTLARLFRRPNSSVLAKMANLDGSRPNGAKHEVEVAARLLESPDNLAILYRLLVAAARDVGIDTTALPDFLGLEDDHIDLSLVGQEELRQADIEAAVQGAAETWTRLRPDLDERLTERLLVATARIGQHRFARDVLFNHGHRCVFCGLAVITGAGGRADRMLVASHIKPWRASNPRERLDVRNGLTACPTHDAAFDTGLLAVGAGLRIQVRTELREAAQTDVATRAAFGHPPLAERLLIPSGAELPRSTYLAWHREHIHQAR